MKELVTVQNRKTVVTSSRTVAEVFGKLHKNVLAAIDDILLAENSANKFFYKSSYTYRGRTLPEYLMNRDGFSLLVMGFTGKKALEWKIKYIEAFNAMERKIREAAAPQLSPMKRYTWRGVIIMPLTELEKLCGICRANILCLLKYDKVPYLLLHHGDMRAFKEENGFMSCASRACLLDKAAVLHVLKKYSTPHRDLLARFGQQIEAYFTPDRPAQDPIFSEIMQLYMLRSTIGYGENWKKKSIVAEYIVDHLMALDLWTPTPDYKKPEDILNINSAAGWSLCGTLSNAHTLLRKGIPVTRENLDRFQREVNEDVGYLASNG